MVCGVGYDRAAELGPVASRFHDIRRVVTNLGVFDFETPDHRMRLRSVHPGVTVDEVVEATGFELVIDDDFDETRLPTDEELRLIREVHRPQRHPHGRGPRMTAHDRALHTRVCELFGVEHPIVQTGMGWVAGARLTSATSAAGGLGILASATMTFDELAPGHRRGQGPHRQALRREPARRPARHRRAHRPAHPRGRAGRLVRPGPQPRRHRQAARTPGVVTMPTVGARRHAEKVAEWGVDAVIAQGAEGGGHTGRRAHVAAAAPGGRHRRHPRARRRRLHRRPGPGRRAGLGRGRHRHGHALPADQGLDGARRGEAALPRPRR